MKRRLQRVVMIATALLFTTAAYSQNQFKNVYGTGGNEFPMEYRQKTIDRSVARAVTQAPNGYFLFLGVSSITATWPPCDP